MSAPRRSLIAGMAMAAAAAGMLASADMRSEPRFPAPIKKRRSRKQADRSKKQYLLKGVRP